MIGSFDFCGHYEWTFAWLEKRGGEELLNSYWKDAIAEDAQIHASALIRDKGFDGMMEYWGHTLLEESPDAGYKMTRGKDFVRCDMHDCPSKGFLIRNGLEQHRDYCDHCIGWIGPVLEDAGYRASHEHNHAGQCWWEFRKKEDSAEASSSGELSGDHDVRHLPEWNRGKHDLFGNPPKNPALPPP